MKNAKTRIDRLSDLPDVLIIHILSYLKTREAVQTCVLSKRWRDLWSFVTTLYFVFDDFLPDDVDYDDLTEYELKFEQFVGAVLRHRCTSILDKFELVYSSIDCKSEAFTEWILYALNCKPRVIYLNVDRFKEIELPDLLFDCKSLEKMTLRFEASLTYKEFKTMNLPSLKRLELSAWIVDDYVLNKFLTGCPALEELILNRCVVTSQIISSNQLKRLVIDDFISHQEIQISIPSLSSLVIHSGRGRIWLKDMSSLMTARLVLCSYDNNIAKQVYKILNGFSNAKDLEFVLTGCGSKAIIKKELSSCPTFENLKSLHFDGYMINDLDLIAHFLQHAPNLEKLSLTHREPYSRSQEITSTTNDGELKCEYVPLVEIIHEYDHKRVNLLVKMLRTYIKRIGKLNMYWKAKTYC